MALFWTLSYAWGPMENPKEILVNDMPFHVTANLHAALTEFRSLHKNSNDKDPVPLLWVDSICLNQADKLEKSMEIPRIRLIYSQCKRVLAWLGPVRPDEDEAVSELVAKMDYFDSLASESGTTVYQHIQAYKNQELGSLSAERQRLQATLKDIGERAWFKRIWVVQETTLASVDPIMLLGPYKFSFEAYFSLRMLLDLYDLPDPETASPSGTLCHALVRMTCYQPSDAMGETGEQPSTRERLVSNMLEFMVYTSGLQATIPHDYIYGLIGLMRQARIPPHLTPNYGLPFEEVYYEFSKYLLSQTSDPAVLSLGQLGLLKGVPSWIPDFRHRNPRTGEYRPQSVLDLTILSSGILAVSAVVLGECISTFPAQVPQGSMPQHASADLSRSFV